MQTGVKAFCRNPRHKRPPVVGRYAFSAPDDVWERADDGGTDHDMWPRLQSDGTRVWEPRPTFTCPCGRETEYNHDKIQSMIREAVTTGDRLWVL